MQRYTLDMGRPPEEEEDPTTAQLARLHKRVVQLKQAPCVDFGVWVPFWEAGAEAAEFSDVYPDRGWNLSDARAARSSKLPAMDGLLEGFQAAAIMLGIVSRSALLNYEKMIERLVVQWPAAWGLVCQAEDKARAERLERIRRNFVVDQTAGKIMLDDWDAGSPWTACFRALTTDEAYWNEQVRHAAVSWTASGGRGAPWRRQRPSLGRTAWEWSRRPVISLRRPPTARSRRTGTRGPPRRDGRKSRRGNCKGSSSADRKRPPRTPRRARAKASPRIRPVFSYATVGPQGPGRVQMFRQAGITSAKSREFISASFACLRLTATTLARLSE